MLNSRRLVDLALLVLPLPFTRGRLIIAPTGWLVAVVILFYSCHSRAGGFASAPTVTRYPAPIAYSVILSLRRQTKPTLIRQSSVVVCSLGFGRQKPTIILTQVITLIHSLRCQLACLHLGFDFGD